MKHCPRCRQEYEDRAEVCADCKPEVRLVAGHAPDEPPVEDGAEIEESERPAVGEAVLARLDRAEALELVERLRASGVRARVVDAGPIAGPSHLVLVAGEDLGSAARTNRRFEDERQVERKGPVLAPPAAMNPLDRFCAAPAFVLGLVLLVLGVIGAAAGCRANFTLPPVLGALPAIVGWGILRSVWIAWRVPRR